LSLIDIHTHQKSGAATSLCGIYSDFQNLDADGVYSLGLHPMMVQSYDAIAIESAYQAMVKKQVWAIGEVGLDKRNKAYWDLQITLFQQQIEIANALQKPLIIHCVQAIDACFLYLKAAQVPVIFHGFRKSLPVAKQLLQQGYYISFGAALLQDASLQMCFKQLPLDQLFLETDDSPIAIDEVYETAAKVLQTEIENVILPIQENFNRIFKLA